MLRRFVLLVLFCSLSFSSLRASHVMGIGIYYDHIDSLKYKVTVSFYRYCGGSAFSPNSTNQNAAPAATSMTYRYYIDSLGTNNLYEVELDTAYELDVFCPSVANTWSSCIAGYQTGIFGVQYYRYIDTIDLDTINGIGPNDRMWMSMNARTPATSLYSYGSIMAEASIDPYAQNNSVRPLTIDIPFMYGDSVAYDLNLDHWDPDGDSLVYTLDTAQEFYFTTTGYDYVQYDTSLFPFSGLQPMQYISLDSATGTFSMTPVIMSGFVHSNYPIAWKVYEYDPITGDYKGFVHQDIQFLVVDDTLLKNPTPVTGAINLSGGSLIGNSVLEVCQGGTFCYSVQFADSNAGDTLVGQMVMDSSLFNVTLTQTGVNPVTFQICGTALQPIPFGEVLTVKVYDDHCPYSGIGNFPLVVKTACSTQTYDSISICDSTWVNLDYNTDSLVTWNVISGSPIVMGTNFNCLDSACSEVELAPSQTTEYSVIQYFSNGFSYNDTFTVHVTQQPNVVLTLSGDQCKNESLELALDVTNASSYNRVWIDTASRLLAPSFDTSAINTSLPGTFGVGYYVEVNSVCTDSGQIEFEIFDLPVWQGLSGFPSQTCLGDSAVIDPVGSYDHHYSPATYLSDTTGTPTAYFEDTIQYSITMTDTNNCKKSAQITIEPQLNMLSGKMVDSSGNLMNKGWVHLIGYNAQLDSVYLVATDTLEIDGYFNFIVPDSAYFIKAVPDSSWYAGLIPTYFQGVPTVQMADLIATQYCDSDTVQFIMAEGVNPGGPGFIGGLISQGAGRGEGDPVVDLPVMLMNSNQRIIEWVTTNEVGRFEFDSIKAGDYTIWVDRWGVQNELGPSISLDEEIRLDSLEFTLLSDRLRLERPQGFDVIGQPSVVLFPNPSNDRVIIQVEGGRAEVSVYDYTGGKIEHRADVRLSTELDVSTWSSGVYLVRVENERGAVSLRIVVQH